MNQAIERIAGALFQYCLSLYHLASYIYHVLQDLSSNELLQLPSSMGELISLKELNVKRNQLVSLPDGKWRYQSCFFLLGPVHMQVSAPSKVHVGGLP